MLTAKPSTVALQASVEVAEVLDAHRELLEHSLRSRLYDAPLTATGEALRRYLVATMGDRRAERLRALFLDSGNRLICDELIADGTPSGVWVEPQAILRRAVELHAVGLIVVHNHPGGQSFPSNQDARFTRALGAAAQALGIRLQDHLIVAGDVCVSLRAEGFIQ